MALDFFAGCVGGCAGVIVGHPFDTIKVRLQTQDPARPRYAGTLHCLRTMVREESVRGLYRGVTSPLAGVSLVNALLFGVYGNVQRQAARRLGLDADAHSTSSATSPSPSPWVALSLLPHAVAGGVAGAVQSLVCSPVELAKTRLQLQSGASGASQALYRGPLDCLKKIHAREGVRGVFLGLGPTLLRDVPAMAVYFASYEVMTRGDQQVSTLHLLTAGGLAGSASWLVTYPVDVVKSRVQADGMDGERRYRSAWHCFRSSLDAEGPRSLFRGLNSTLLRAFPTNAATFTAVAWTMRFLEGAQELELHSQPQGQGQAVPQALRQSLHHADLPDPVVPVVEWLGLHCHLTMGGEL